MFKMNNLIYQSKLKLKEVVSGYSHCGCQVMVPGAGVTRRLSPRSPVWIMLTCNAGVMLTPQLTASVDPITC